MSAFYNENDPGKAEWLRNLIAADVIAPGVVDERDIRDITPVELAGYNQCHFFAGIGIWSYALRQARWADNRPVWTGSCPCQPFSTAGRGKGTADERHLWPALFHLIDQCEPERFYGEQVASKDGLAWLDLVQADMEGAGYTIGALDTCAAGFGAPHIRQRLHIGAARLANGEGCGWRQKRQNGSGKPFGNTAQGGAARSRSSRGSGRLADMYEDGQREGRQRVAASGHDGVIRDGTAGGVVHGIGTGLEGQPGDGDGSGQPGRLEADADGSAAAAGGVGDSRPINGFWGSADWLGCRDGKWRPVEPGTFPLAHGAPARVLRLRAYGDGIVAPQAIEFIKAFDEVTACPPTLNDPAPSKPN